MLINLLIVCDFILFMVCRFILIGVVLKYFVSSGRIYFVCSALGQVKKKDVSRPDFQKKKRRAEAKLCERRHKCYFIVRV